MPYLRFLITNATLIYKTKCAKHTTSITENELFWGAFLCKYLLFLLNRNIFRKSNQKI